jgi:hypothetical protein
MSRTVNKQFFKDGQYQWMQPVTVAWSMGKCTVRRPNSLAVSYSISINSLKEISVICYNFLEIQCTKFCNFDKLTAFNFNHSFSRHFLDIAKSLGSTNYGFSCRWLYVLVVCAYTRIGVFTVLVYTDLAVQPIQQQYV